MVDGLAAQTAVKSQAISSGANVSSCTEICSGGA